MEAGTLEAVQRMSRDIRAAAATMTDQEARFLVDAYYIMQEDRKRSSNQTRSADESGEPNMVLSWYAAQSATVEDQIKGALDKYTQGHRMGEWMRAVYGIGPVLSAGLLAHIDIRRAPTVGHIWRFAGLGPTVVLLLAFFSGFNILEASLPSLVSRLAPASAKGAALGLYNTAQSLGLFAGGAVGGLVARYLGESAVFLGCAALLGAWLLVARRHRRWPDRRAAGATA